MVHKDIRIPFKVDGHCFEAVGFIGAYESSVKGDIMLKRVPCAIGEDDFRLLSENFGEWPIELYYYRLASAWRVSHNPCDVHYFYRDDDWWWWGSQRIYWEWGEDFLVLRRVVKK